MKSSLNYIKRLPILFSIVVAGITVPGTLHGQDRDKYDSIAAKYSTENAVYTNKSEQLVITIEDGELVANNYATMEKLFISDLSLTNYNRDYFFYGDYNALTDYSGVAYLPLKGKKYKKVDCNGFGSGSPSDYVFYDDIRYVQAYYSGLCKNAITETRYSTTNADVHMLPGFVFQDIMENLPVVKASYEVVVPIGVNMSFAIEGGNTSMIKQTKEEKNGKIYYRFTATDIPAPRKFDNVPSWRYYVPHVIPYITSFRLNGAKKDSVIAKTPDDLYRYLYNFVRCINVKTDTPLAKVVAELTKNDNTPKEKAEHIYKWVQKNIHYVAIENGLEGFVPRSADTVLKRKYGDCKDMASISLAMCRKAGLKAYVAWIGTTELPYTIEKLPLNVNFNHMICAVKNGDEWIFLDGTNPVQPYGYNRDDIQGKQVLISIDEKNYKIVTIPVLPASKNMSEDSTHVTIDGRKLLGWLSQVYKGYDAWDIAYKMMYNNREDERQKMVKGLTVRGSNKYTQGKYDLNAQKSGDKDVTISADFIVDDYVQQVGKECFVNMNLLHYFEGERIDMKDRKVDKYYDRKAKHKEVVVLDIPKGYKVSYLPTAVKGSLDNIWNYSISYKADKQKITLTKEYEINALAISPDKFFDNNKMIDDLKKYYNESVVLTAK